MRSIARENRPAGFNVLELASTPTKASTSSGLTFCRHAWLTLSINISSFLFAVSLRIYHPAKAITSAKTRKIRRRRVDLDKNVPMPLLGLCREAPNDCMSSYLYAIYARDIVCRALRIPSRNGSAYFAWCRRIYNWFARIEFNLSIFVDVISPFQCSKEHRFLTPPKANCASNEIHTKALGSSILNTGCIPDDSKTGAPPSKWAAASIVIWIIIATI